MGKIFNITGTFIFCVRDTHNGGPVHWIMENYQCPNCFKDPYKQSDCCKTTNGGFCKADSVSITDDPDVSIASCVIS